MSNYEIYKNKDLETNKLASQGEFLKAQKLAKELCEWRDENFTKEDWKELINKSSGRAKYEYTKIMNELFPN